MNWKGTVQIEFLERMVRSYVQEIVDQPHLIVHGERTFRKVGQESTNHYSVIRPGRDDVRDARSEVLGHWFSRF